MTITQQQVRAYLSQRAENKQQITAAAKAGISERTGRRIEQGKQTPAQGKPRQYRTRKDPFSAVWGNELLPKLRENPQLQVKTLLQDLQQHYVGQYPICYLRTLQRRISETKFSVIEDLAKHICFKFAIGA